MPYEQDHNDGEPCAVQYDLGRQPKEVKGLADVFVCKHTCCRQVTAIEHKGGFKHDDQRQQCEQRWKWPLANRWFMNLRVAHGDIVADRRACMSNDPPRNGRSSVLSRWSGADSARG